MSSQKLNNGLQIITALAVLLGLALVVWELQLIREEAQAQITSDNWAIAQGINTAMFGENGAATVAKACSEATELTDEDLVVLHHYYQSYLIMVTRAYGIQMRSGLYDDQWKFAARGTFSRIFTTGAGRAWWRVSRSKVSPSVRTFIDSMHDEYSDDSSCSPDPATWRAEMLSPST